MSIKKMVSVAGLALSLFSASAVPQSGGTFEITKSVIAGGGGQSTGGAFTLDGTIGQSIAGTSSTGGSFELTGGFWGGQAAPVSNVTISGKVLTASGLALRNAIVTLIDSQNVRRTSTTGSFGLYSFDNVRTGETYIMSVASKRFRFAPLITQFTASVSNLDFQGLE
jgi:hypothetical protein